MRKPDRLELANLPTPIWSLDGMDYCRENARLFIKRDDFTGFEISGNKVRKLEYALKHGMDQGAEVFITCGGIQSNHVRAVASAAALFSRKAHLVLKGSDMQPDGNYFLDLLFGASVQFISEEDYKCRRQQYMEDIRASYARRGIQAYIIPEGASNGIGFFGYFQAYEEIMMQERLLREPFDTICVADGSGGTYAGLYAANELYGCRKRIVGFNIYDKNADAEMQIAGIVEEGLRIGGCRNRISYDRIQILYDYVGEGYGITSSQVMDFIHKTALQTGILLDPVYTGKAMYGVVSELYKRNPLLTGNVLFIHTGGQFGIFPQRNRFCL